MSPAAPTPGSPGQLGEAAAGATDPWLRVLFDESRTGMLILDWALAVRRANAALRTMLTRPVAPGTPLRTLLDGDEWDHLAAALRAALDGSAPGEPVVSRLGRGSGQPPLEIEIAIESLREAGGSVSALLLSLTDRSAARRAETELAHGRRLQAIGQLAGGIAHDFNNLLAAIIAGVDLALERVPADPATGEDLRQIRRSAERGAALVCQILAFGRKQPLKSRPVPVNGAIGDLAGLLRRLLGARVRLVLAFDAVERAVRVDPTQFDQVLVNLATNARDAMAAGGTLTIRTGQAVLETKLLRDGETIPPGRYVAIAVEDTGAGIPPQVLPHIFEPFFTTRRERGGTGLGLATVHGIVRQSGGFIIVDSAPGRGTAIRLHLPECEAEAGTAPDPPAATDLVAGPIADAPPVDRQASGSAAGLGSGRTVLLVDDEDALRELAARALKARGWTVLAAASGEEALTLLDGLAESGRQAPSILVSDVTMPGADGADLVRAVRERLPHLPALLVSGYAEEGSRARMQTEAREVAFLAKPFSLRALLAKIEEMTTAEGAPDAGQTADPEARNVENWDVDTWERESWEGEP